MLINVGYLDFTMVQSKPKPKKENPFEHMKILLISALHCQLKLKYVYRCDVIYDSMKKTRQRLNGRTHQSLYDIFVIDAFQEK